MHVEKEYTVYNFINTHILGDETIHTELGTDGCIFLGVIFYQCIWGALTDTLPDMEVNCTSIGHEMSAGGVYIFSLFL